MNQAIDMMDDNLLAFAWDNIWPRDRSRVLTDAPKTAWVFGAGASHHYNLNSRGVPVPLANGFFRIFNSLPTSEGFHAHVGPLVSYLHHSRGIEFDEMYKWEENIEEFMTSIERGLNELREKKKQKQLDAHDKEKVFELAMLFNNMNFIFGNVLNEAQNGPSLSMYHELLKFCRSDDIFITFNWDTLLDRALADTGGWTPTEGYSISFASTLDGTWKNQIDSSATYATKWKLLKLHGSTNWLVPYSYIHFESLEYGSLIPDSDVFLYWQSTLPYQTYRSRWRGGYVPTCYGYYPPNLPPDSFSYDQLVPESGKTVTTGYFKGIFSPFDEPSEKGIPSSPLLITPVQQKRYDIYQSVFDGLWKDAEDALSEAERIVIVGYSFPPTDTRPLDIIRNTLSSRKDSISIEVVAPDADIVISHIGNDYFAKTSKVTIHNMKFEDYIATLWSNSPEMMKLAASKNDKVKDWLERINMMKERSSTIFQ